MNDMIEVKVEESTGPVLDYLTGMALGIAVSPALSTGGVVRCIVLGERNTFGGSEYLRGEVRKNWMGSVKIDSLKPIGWVFSPSTDWVQGGPLIEKYKVWLAAPYDHRKRWDASVGDSVDAEFGETALIAVCRAIVVEKLGVTASVPAELIAP